MSPLRARMIEDMKLAGLAAIFRPQASNQLFKRIVIYTELGSATTTEQ